MSRDLLTVDRMRIEYRERGLPLARQSPPLVAVEDISFSIPRGTTLALVGESGSGKTSVARGILGLVPLTAGRVLLGDVELTAPGKLPRREQRREIQMVFQQPTASLDPRMRVGDSIAEPLVYLLGMRGRELSGRVAELLEMVGLDAAHARSYPRNLSGGQRQRVAIARAIGPKPKLVICDEPTTSLDVSVQAQVINLLSDLQNRTGTSLLFISHNLGLVRQIAAIVAVMYRGRIVQFGTTSDVLENPTHEYARSLIEAVPRLNAIDPESTGWPVHSGEPSPAPPTQQVAG